MCVLLIIADNTILDILLTKQVPLIMLIMHLYCCLAIICCSLGKLTFLTYRQILVHTGVTQNPRIKILLTHTMTVLLTMSNNNINMNIVHFNHHKFNMVIVIVTQLLKSPTSGPSNNCWSFSIP